MSKEEQERLEQFNQTVDEYKKHREELEQNGDEKLYLDELFLMKYQDNGNTKYAVIKHWGNILYTSYYSEYTYLVYSNAEEKGFWDAIKFFNNNQSVIVFATFILDLMRNFMLFVIMKICHFYLKNMLDMMK